MTHLVGLWFTLCGAGGWWSGCTGKGKFDADKDLAEIIDHANAELAFADAASDDYEPNFFDQASPFFSKRNDKF